METGGCKISFDLDDGASVSIGGYRIMRKGNRICTDRSSVFPECENQKNFQMQSMTPELKDGCHLDVYVEPNMVEVYVNRGEYVISHAVYGLSDELVADSGKRLTIFAVGQES